MCTFVTLIAATDDLDRINAILATWDSRGQTRRAERVDTPGLRTCLEPAEREYWLTRSPCDCGTYLGSAVQRSDRPDDERVAEIARYRRKGWSEARIARAVADKDRAVARPARNPLNEDATYWIDLLTALAEGLKLQEVGLMHHFYRKAPGAEPETASRNKAGYLARATEVLDRMEDGVIYDFLFKVRRPGR
jgi:hypothetical protein